MINIAGKSIGQKVVVDDENNLLFRIAPDIHENGSELTIDERDLGKIRKGQVVQSQIDAYPNRYFKGTMKISVFLLLKRIKKGRKTYYARVGIDNSEEVLHPGMHLNARIYIRAQENVLSITSRSFLIKEELIRPLANFVGFSIKPFEKKDANTSAAHHTTFVWKIDEENKTFIENVS